MAPKDKTRFDVLLCKQPEGWKSKFYSKFKNLFDRQGCSKNHVVSTKFKYPLCPLQEKGRRFPKHLQEKVHEEMEKLLNEVHIKRLDKCTSDCFIAPIVITVKKDDSIKLALDVKPINRQLFKNKYQMPYVDELLDGVSQIVTANANGTLYFSVLDLNSKSCEITFCFPDDILIVSKTTEQEHEKLIMNVLEKLDKENLALKLSKCEFFQNEVNWLGHKLSLDGIPTKNNKNGSDIEAQSAKIIETTQVIYG